jgi:hypothetical protein
MAGLEVSLEGHIDREVAQFVAVAQAVELQQTDAGFTVPVFSESGRHGPYSTRNGRGEAERR